MSAQTNQLEILKTCLERLRNKEIDQAATCLAANATWKYTTASYRKEKYEGGFDEIVAQVNKEEAGCDLRKEELVVAWKKYFDDPFSDPQTLTVRDIEHTKDAIACRVIVDLVNMDGKEQRKEFHLVAEIDEKKGKIVRVIDFVDQERYEQVKRFTSS
ncbi:hypothetical protein JCM1840_004766 [Sporobolomyces johnsonii]